MTAPDTTAARVKLAAEIADLRVTERKLGALIGQSSVALHLTGDPRKQILRDRAENTAKRITALLAPAAALPEGWVAVPREPNAAMCEAGWIDKEDVSPAEIYRAMLAASPEPPAPSAAGAWRTDMENAPRTSTEDMRAKDFLAWCPDEEAVLGGDRRVCWWEPRMKGGKGCWYSDRDMEEHPTHWWSDPLPAPPDPPAAIPPGTETTEVGR